MILQTVGPHDMDYLLAMMFAVGGTLVTIISYLVKKRLELYDQHLEECRERAVTTGRMDERLKSVEADVTQTRSAVHWLGSCIITIGSKVGADLPDRPDDLL